MKIRPPESRATSRRPCRVGRARHHQRRRDRHRVPPTIGRRHRKRRMPADGRRRTLPRRPAGGPRPGIRIDRQPLLLLLALRRRKLQQGPPTEIPVPRVASGAIWTTPTIPSSKPSRTICTSMVLASVSSGRTFRDWRMPSAPCKRRPYCRCSGPTSTQVCDPLPRASCCTVRPELVRPCSSRPWRMNLSAFCLHARRRP
mmetsp:Transcript_31257/g.91552  ORF Transcript_31257/g.91552 Transcript_31257/m.91552 type:complete len:200 (+) Transcript_31257:296-895(+)